ncbi:MAG TPA: alpha-hydroxyketone-type quorum-sensing autoinducer synthase [Tahibacter sp.]|uniref:alpha-hydroxyketone-type quorum-sensing autoinducer synthase n=1 Tax=Tahibacter sp. TaxID=2056211 RepID=UPI002D012C30|nr:alpha-hydroxyketone-type quorum-sensing autoinducer synthase [Tahibacter sp.]HSX62053.1 alpha-hydroxyketone-type quorum-sensing autoinducer synthase [Tahibacter sp.]
MSISFPSVVTSSFPQLQQARAPELPEFARQRVERFHQDRVQASWSGRHILRGLRPAPGALMLQSNDYLALGRHPEIVDAQRAALASAGNGNMMSGLFLQQDDDPMHQVEHELAVALGSEETILCQSGYVANVGLVQCLAGERTPVYIDMLAHASLWEGIKAAGAQAVPVYHNDPEYLERQILRHGPGVILVDSIYSTNGSVCPLADFAAIAQRRSCVFVVDESHSIGTHGVHGEGLVASLGLTDRVHFVTASLAKAYCVRAGLISCSTRFKPYFAFESMPAIFSSTLLPQEIAAVDASHRVIRREGWRRARLQYVTRRVREALLGLGYPIGEGTEQIIALEVGSEAAVMRVRDAFEAESVFGAIFCAPATAKNRALLRLTLHAGLDDAGVNQLIDACARLRDKVDLADWSATRRERRNAGRPALVDVA